MLLCLPAGMGPEEKGSTVSPSTWKTGRLFSPAAEGCLFWARFNGASCPARPRAPAHGEAEGHNLPGEGSRVLSPPGVTPPGAALPFLSTSFSFPPRPTLRGAGDALSCLAPGWPDGRDGAAERHDAVPPCFPLLAKAPPRYPPLLCAIDLKKCAWERKEGKRKEERNQSLAQVC